MEATAPRRLSLKSAAAEASRRRRVAQARPSLQDARAHAVGDTWRRGKSFWQLRFLQPAAAGHTVDGTLPRYFAVRSLLARADRRVDASVASVAGETLNPAAAAERAADVCGEWASYADGALTIHEYVRSHPRLDGPLLLMARVAAWPLPGGCALPPPEGRYASVALPGAPRSALHLAADGSATYEVHDSVAYGALLGDATYHEDRRGTGRWAIEGEHGEFLVVRISEGRMSVSDLVHGDHDAAAALRDAPPARCALSLAYERLPDGLCKTSGGEWLARGREVAVDDGGAAAPKRQDPLVSALLAVRALRVVTAWDDSGPE